MEQIWYKDPLHLFTKDNFMNFIPSRDLNYEENLNSMVRFSIYFSVIIFILRRNFVVFMFPLIVMLITFFMSKTKQKEILFEHLFLKDHNLEKNRYTNVLCQKPTEHNPFMNVMMNDYYENPNRKKACNISQKNIKREAEKYFNKNLYRSVSDIFNKEASDRQWITNPITTIPNDQNAFAKWCYQRGPSCKEGSKTQCWNNIYKSRT